MSVFAFSSNNAKEHLLGLCADGLVVSVQGMEAELDVGDQGSNLPSAAEFISVENFFQKKAFLFVPLPFPGLPLFHLHLSIQPSSPSLLPPQICQSVFLICFIAPGMLAS